MQNLEQAWGVPRQVTHHALCIWSGHNACSGEIGSFGADIAIVLDAVAANSPADTVGTVFSRQCAQTIYRYVALVPTGSAVTGLKNMVLVPGATAVPWASWCISVMLAACQ